jgi:hypothetical protein
LGKGRGGRLCPGGRDPARSAQVDGSGAVHYFSIANAKLVFQTNGYFEVDGNVDINLRSSSCRAG